MSSIDDFSGKTILITGASSGLGKSCAEYLFEHNAKLVLVARSHDKLEMLAKAFPSHGSYVYSCDLSDVANIKGLFEFIKSQSIKLDGLIYCAGQAINCPISQFDYDEAIKLFNLNYFSFCEIMKYCAMKKYMNSGSGIAAVSSTSAILGGCAQGSYAASKCALEGYVRIAAKELMHKSIRVNAVQPAQINTEMTQATFAALDGFEDKVNKVQMLGIIDPSNLAKLIAYLISDDAKYITGRAIPFDAGILSSFWMV